MLHRPIVINDLARLTTCHAASIAYLDARRAKSERLAIHFRAHDHIGSLIPQTTENFASGHFFPYAESRSQLEISYLMTLMGLYGPGRIALRSVLELSLLQVHFAADDNEARDVAEWLRSRDRTPNRRSIFSKLGELDYFRAFDSRFGLFTRVSRHFDAIDQFAHTRGMRHSHLGLNRGSNVIEFSAESFEDYIESACPIITMAIELLLLKYPIGMQALPLDEKFGFEGPVGGFLREDQVKVIRGILPQEELDFLQLLSDTDASVRATVKAILAMPDISEEDLQRQSKGLDELLGIRKPADDV